MKQRLIGAAVLIALAVIFLPMLIKGPAPESGVADVPLSMPAEPDGQIVTRELPLVMPGSAGQEGALGMPQATDAGSAAAPAPAAAQPAAAAGDFAVHFGAYATRADADAVNAQLRGAQLPGYVEETQVSGKPAWRVRIGPYATRAEAESARLRAVELRNDVGARVVTLDAGAAPTASAPTPRAVTTTPATPPRPAAVATPLPAPTTTAPTPQPLPAPAATPRQQSAPQSAASPPKPAATPAPATPPAPSAPAAADVGFAVQLGAFGNAEEAARLRDRARAAGFSAFTETVRGESGVLTRVRVGPVATRAEADRLKSQVDGRLGTAGMVRPHP